MNYGMIIPTENTIGSGPGISISINLSILTITLLLSHPRGVWSIEEGWKHRKVKGFAQKNLSARVGTWMQQFKFKVQALYCDAILSTRSWRPVSNFSLDGKPVIIDCCIRVLKL